MAAGIVLIGTILAPILSSLLAEEVRLILKTHLNDYYLHVLAGGLTICAFILFFIHFNDKTKPIGVVAQEDLDIRKQLIQNFREIYKNRYVDKMKGDLRLDIDLKLKYTTTGTNPERVEKFYKIKEESSISDFDSLLEDYIKNINRLLILGEPGAGKSILLLRFGLKLIEEAEKNEHFPVPVILDLATWRTEDQTFEHWLEQNLPYIGGSFLISKEESRKLIDSNTLLLLLDGFDEIQEQYRNSCLERMQVYLHKLRNSRKETLPEVILCSRISEYLSADDAPVFATVEIQPLQPKDVQAVLQSMAKNNDEPAIELQLDLIKNVNLYTAITSAFFLHILLNIYTQEKNPNFTSNSKESLQREIVEKYIQLELEKLTDFQLNNAKKWLGWLAYNLKHTTRTVTFELIDLQSYWTKSKDSLKWFYSSIFSIIFGITVGFLSAYVSSDTFFDLSNAVMVFLCTFPAIFFLFDRYNKVIVTQEIKEFNLKKISLRIYWHRLFTRIGRITSYFTVASLFAILFSIPTLEELIETYYFIVPGAIFLGITVGLPLGIISGIINGFFSESSFPRIETAYKRFLSRFCYDIFEWPLILGFLYWLIGPNADVFSGLLIGLSISILCSPIFKHFCLRLILSHEMEIPLKLVTFLNSTSSCSGILIRNGGQWRFRHQLILDSLASWFKENHSNLLRQDRVYKHQKI